jgi:hypothetical protein
MYRLFFSLSTAHTYCSSSSQRIPSATRAAVASVGDESGVLDSCSTSLADDDDAQLQAVAAAAAAAARPVWRSFVLLLQAVEIRACKDMPE